MEESAPTSGPDRLTLVLRIILAAVGLTILVVAGWVGYAYVDSPAAIRHPQATHYHFRLQIINGGSPVNFADAKYQTPFNKDICTAALTKEPIHFHDNLDQFVHIHWAGITGGLLLKNYGWNLIDGPAGALGYRFDQLPHLTQVAIHGLVLPAPPKDAQFYIYTGNQDGYQERDWNSFLNEDLRDFFAGKKAAIGSHWPLVPTAWAHGDDEKLTQLNDVLGSVVIFAQKDRPTDQQIKDRFNHLVPLPESSCGG